MVPQDVPSNLGTTARSTETWDPYDVWLKRVKLPRDRQPARAVAIATRVEAVAVVHRVEDRTEPSRLLPHVS